MNYKFIGLGVLFAALWASASSAAKMSLVYIQPLWLFQIRFFLAGLILLVIAHIFNKERLPKGKEWIEISIFGLLNTTLYLSLFVLAIREISAGIGSLSTSTNTLFISILSTFWLGKSIKTQQWLALTIGLLGVTIACYPLLINNHATPRGMLTITLSMLAYSVGTIYYSKTKWTLSRTTINGWQVFLGGLFMLPLSFMLHEPGANHITKEIVFSVIWLVIPVSIIAVQIWLYLLKENPVKASYFLFLCPIFGFVYAYFLLDEPISSYTFVGTSFVLFALYLGQKTT